MEERREIIEEILVQEEEKYEQESRPEVQPEVVESQPSPPSREPEDEPRVSIKMGTPPPSPMVGIVGEPPKGKHFCVIYNHLLTYFQRGYVVCNKYFRMLSKHWTILCTYVVYTICTIRHLWICSSYPYLDIPVQ